jgi:hypothetical protein
MNICSKYNSQCVSRSSLLARHSRDVEKIDGGNSSSMRYKQDYAAAYGGVWRESEV